MTKGKKFKLKTIMWRLLKSRKVVSYDDLQELAGVSRSYAQEWMATLVRRKVVKKLDSGKYRLSEHEEPVVSTPCLPGNMPEAFKFQRRSNIEPLKAGNAPEKKLWKAILEMKVFSLTDLIAKDIANKTTVRQYVTVLTRAGFLAASKNWPCVYSLADITGEKAPLMGRALYLYDPNTNRIWDDIPVSRKVINETNKNGLEDGQTSCQARSENKP